MNKINQSIINNTGIQYIIIRRIIGNKIEMDIRNRYNNHNNSKDNDKNR